MSHASNHFVCQVGSLAMGAAAGALAFVLLMLLGGWTFWAAVLAAGVIAGALWLVLAAILCTPLSGPVAPGSAGRTPGDIELSARARKVAQGGARSGAPTASAASAHGAAASVSDGVRETVSNAADAVADAAEQTAEAASDAADATTAAAAQAVEAAGAADKVAAAKDAVASATSEPAKAAAEAVDTGTKPETLGAPRGGKPDNLKEIKGVGPKMEKMLHEMGFYHFDQIAAWSPDEVAWVNENLTGFKGRVTRDDWVAQAAVLAAGGETEFSKRVEDGDVY